MNTIYKYKLDGAKEQEILTIPGPIVHFLGEDGYGLEIWIRGDPEARINRTVRVFMTGEDIPDGWEYISTIRWGWMVGHLHEKET